MRDYIVHQFPRWGTAGSADRHRGEPALGIALQRRHGVERPGTLNRRGNTKAVILAGHYDSVSSGPGASDDGHSVAMELETLRALRSGPPLRNDIVFLFTDSEEGGLLGAKAFVEHHPLAKQAGLVMNFEARGTSGPAMMFETSEGNGRIVREFAAAAPDPITSSLSYEAYKLLPNDTDLTIFKQAGLPGLGFAYVDESPTITRTGRCGAPGSAQPATGRRLRAGTGAPLRQPRSARPEERATLLTSFCRSSGVSSIP